MQSSKGLAKKHARFSFDDSITNRIEECLEYVEDITKRYDDSAAFLRIIRPMTAHYGVKKLAEIEHKLNTVLNLINTAVNSDTNENKFAILSGQESGRVAVIQEIQKLSKMRDTGAEHADDVPDEWIVAFDSVPNLSF
jgi:hypothetical protein